MNTDHLVEKIREEEANILDKFEKMEELEKEREKLNASVPDDIKDRKLRDKEQHHLEKIEHKLEKKEHKQEHKFEKRAEKLEHKLEKIEEKKVRT